MQVLILVAILAAALSCLFSSLHFALRDFSLRKLEDIAGRNGGLGRLEPIIRNPNAHAQAMSALRAIANVALIGSILLMFPFIMVEPSATAPAGVAGEIHRHVIFHPPAMIAAGLTAAAVVYLIGHLIPMSVADHAGEKLIHSTTGFIRLIYFICAPLRMFWFIDAAIQRLAGVHNVTEAEHLEDELLSVVSEGEMEGQLNENERQMIEAIMAFKASTVEEIMTPRTEIEGFELTNDLTFIKHFIEKAGHSRIPVYEGDLDHIAGVLYAKDLIPYAGRQAEKFDLKSILRAPHFVPETKPLNELLVELRLKKVHIAIVLDEYGGTTGLVTIEDVLEEIVGEIQDEYEPVDEVDPEIVIHSQTRSAEVDARAYIHDANEKLEEIGVELPEGEDYETVGGYVLASLGHIPTEGESFNQNGFVVTVLSAEPTKVTRLRIEVVPDAVEDEKQSSREESAVESASPADNAS